MFTKDLAIVSRCLYVGWQHKELIYGAWSAPVLMKSQRLHKADLD